MNMSVRQPASRNEFTVAIICALPLEAEAVDGVFDCYWDGHNGTPYGKADLDQNTYTLGAIGCHNVVLAHMPGMGKVSAAVVAQGCRLSFPNVRLALVVGICGVVPFPSHDNNLNEEPIEVILGDVIISKSVVQYDLGKQLPDHFELKNTLLDSLGRANPEIRSLIAKLSIERHKKGLQTKLVEHLNSLSRKLGPDTNYPGTQHDRLFKASYSHVRDNISCSLAGCNDEFVPRRRLQSAEGSVQPAVHFGLIASGDKVMKSGEERDATAKQITGVIAFEMESAGVWDVFPCVVMKGACDYADSHKNDLWQHYAAASAAACMKAFLQYWDQLPENFTNKEQECQQQVLERIWFRMMDERRNQIHFPHPKTLQWALHPPNENKKWNILSEWLQSGSGIYWMSGKAGSGKSTLMKHLFHSPEAKKCLEMWASPKTLCIGSFFLWNLGTEEQKSQAGLSRALLFNILNEVPSLIKTLLPGLWHAIMKSDKDKVSLPSLTEMKEAFVKLAEAEVESHKFFFFIDGLDEYAGNCADGIDFSNSLVRNPNIKVLLSSRPITSCVRAFSSRPMLVLQELTHDDIAEYVEDTIGSHEDIHNVSHFEKPRICKIMGEIVSKASGVFLWVVLACRSILDGFSASDSIEELQRRVDELPKDLEKLFQLILDKIEPRYQEQAAKLLRICYQTKLTAHGTRLKTLGLAVVEVQDMQIFGSLAFQPTSHAEKREKCGVLERRLRSRCWGLLEINQVEFNSAEGCLCQLPASKHDLLVDSHIEFLHRSVFEFLNLPDIWNSGVLRIRDETFDPNLILSALSLYLGHISLQGPDDITVAEKYIAECFQYASSASSPSISYILMKFQELLAELSRNNQAELDFDLESRVGSPFLLGLRTLFNQSPDSRTQLALLLAVEAGIKVFTEEYLIVNGPPHPASRGFPLLYHAIQKPHLRSLHRVELVISADLIRTLLSSGCNPNEKFVDEHRKTCTPWTSWLKYIRGDHHTSILLIIEITEIFINEGAELTEEQVEMLEQFVKEILYGSPKNFMDSPRDVNIIRKRSVNLLQLVQQTVQQHPMRKRRRL